MKHLIPILVLLCAGFLVQGQTTGEKASNAAKNQAENEVTSGVRRGVNKGFRKLGGLLKGKDQNKEQEQEPQGVPAAEDPASRGQNTPPAVPSEGQAETAEPNSTAGIPVIERGEKKVNLWVGEYDFIPGSKVLFYDDLQGEELGEFPSRWDLVFGNVENAKADGEPVILMMDRAQIKPLFKEGFVLPEKWTLEFDCYFRPDARDDYYQVYFPDARESDFYVYHDGISHSKQPARDLKKRDARGRWVHVSVSFNQRSLKIYYDQERLINIPNIGKQPIRFQIHTDYGPSAMIRDIRLAEGAKPLYEREFMDNGVFATRNILFELNKATLLDRSYAEINRIAELMKQHPTVAFSIEGHTDSDGSEEHNQSLSKARAEAVMQAMVEMGIDAGRMTARGWGESKPIVPNDTPENKAMNRRVEFVRN